MKYLITSALLAISTNAIHAGDETFACKLYIAGSLSEETVTRVELKNAGLSLDAKRQSGFCIFSDGKVAEKQWVDLGMAVGDGSSGSSMGYSVYTMDNGDSINTKFEGGWGASGFNGLYTILGGTGKYEGAKGDGTITGTASPWESSGIVDIVLNVTTP